MVVCAALSVTEQVTVVAPSGKVEPETGAQAATRPLSTSSVTLGSVQVATAPLALVASRVRPVGMSWRTGTSSS